MSELNELIRVRLDKLRALKERGVQPYPYRFDATCDSAAVLACGFAAR